MAMTFSRGGCDIRLELGLETKMPPNGRTTATVNTTTTTAAIVNTHVIW